MVCGEAAGGGVIVADSRMGALTRTGPGGNVEMWLEMSRSYPVR